MFVAQSVDCDATSFGRVRSELAGIIYPRFGNNSSFRSGDKTVYVCHVTEER